MQKENIRRKMQIKHINPSSSTKNNKNREQIERNPPFSLHAYFR